MTKLKKDRTMFSCYIFTPTAPPLLVDITQSNAEEIQRRMGEQGVDPTATYFFQSPVQEGATAKLWVSGVTAIQIVNRPAKDGEESKEPNPFDFDITHPGNNSVS
jgi:hypothetical protein